MSRFPLVAACFTAATVIAQPLAAQTAVLLPQPQNVLQLAATATIEVPAGLAQRHAVHTA